MRDGNRLQCGGIAFSSKFSQICQVESHVGRELSESPNCPPIVMKVQDPKENQGKSHEEAGFSAEGPQSQSSGASLTPPPFSLGATGNGPAQLQSDGQGVVQRMGIGDWLGDLFNTRDNEADLDLQEDIADFTSKDYGPITYTNADISGSGFEASYYPATKRFLAEVRAKFRFADSLVLQGGKVTSPNEFMGRGQLLTVLNAFPDLLTQVLPYFQWTADEKEVHKVRFMDNIQATEDLWENTGLSFQVADAGWEGVTATPDIEITCSEGEAVTATKNWGPFGIFTSTDEGGSDHLQVEIVKQVNPSDAATVNTLVTNYINNLTPTMPGLLAGLIPPAGDVRGVRSYASPDAKRSGNSEGFNNFMSLRSNGSDNPETQTFEHTVHFGNDSAEITPAELASLDAFFSNPFILSQNPNGAVTVTLRGFASAPGTTKHNTGVVSQRLTAVSDVINGKMDASAVNIKTHVDSATQHNDADRSAEADKKTNPLHNPNDFQRVDIKIEQAGRGGQNTFAHEMGHVFGLGDEYSEVGNGYNRPVGALATHDQLAKDAGVPTGAVVADDNRLMSGGKDVQAAHYSTFADALKRLTAKQWKIV